MRACHAEWGECRLGLSVIHTEPIALDDWSVEGGEVDSALALLSTSSTSGHFPHIAGLWAAGCVVDLSERSSFRGGVYEINCRFKLGMDGHGRQQAEKRLNLGTKDKSPGYLGQKAPGRNFT